jgi:acyl-coenzyme A synthetase/AMP-(fatty) acid ligase
MGTNTSSSSIASRSKCLIERATFPSSLLTPNRLIKVKGMQVAPAELEAHILTHPAVDDCVVIGVPSDREGEVPKAFVVKAPGSIEESDALIKRQIAKHVEKAKSNHKWLRGGIEFIDIVPKSPSGKILRRMMRDQEKEKMKKQGAKL